MMGRGIVVVGSQFGDEGKGKIVDTLSDNADIVARYQGGGNAGHTIVANGKTFKLHLLPSGVVRGKRSLICAGVVVDPRILCAEIDELSALGIVVGPSVLGIDVRTHVIFPWHQALEAASGSGKKIGTTGKGIGPAYEDAAARTGLRFGELIDSQGLVARLREIAPSKQRLIQGVYASGVDDGGAPEMDVEKIISAYSPLGTLLAPFACDTSHEINSALRGGKRVLFEGAQGTFLDKEFGTYPFVTSSHPIAGGACTGAGVGPTAISEVHGVVKAYTTRVGAGPFPTELADGVGELITQKGREFGTTTGRRRRVGWLDACLLRRSCELNGFTCIHITKLDILGGIGKLKVATSYALPDGAVTDIAPADTELLEKAIPNYEELDGIPDFSGEEWRAAVDGGKGNGFNALPANALAYVRRIEGILGVPAASVSVGPGREEIIRAKD